MSQIYGKYMKHEQTALGKKIFDIDLKKVGQDSVSELHDALYENRILIFKNQTLDEKDYINFANLFGYPIPYLQTNYHHPDYPLIFVSSNVTIDGKQIGVPRTGGYWHSDTSFEKDPKVLTMLRPVIVPTNPRCTMFVDMSVVYKNLPMHLKKEVENATFIHSGRYKFKVRKEDIGLDISELLAGIDMYQPPVEHPAVLIHPHTKEEVLYGSSGFTIGIKGKSTDEGRDILNQIFSFAESGQFTNEIFWEPGDLIVWDNRFLVHKSGRKQFSVEAKQNEILQEEKTMMFRITLKDKYPLCDSLTKE